ncbi:MAG: NaeI family type II restriction endonuclease [Cystobacter sp.]
MSVDTQLQAVFQKILLLDPDGSHIGWAIRNSIDQLLDGQHTGRYHWNQLYKTEKTHAGTLVEINIQRSLRLQDGKDLDYSIEDVEVDCKYSQRLYEWMIPPEAQQGQICLVVWASDELSRWSAGLIRTGESHLSPSENRDKKKRLNEVGRKAIAWIFKDHQLPPNVFLQMSEEHVRDILVHRSGQKRVNRLFVHAQGKIVTRAAVATAAQQDDFMKRVRENGGAREKLRPLGIAILGHEHQEIARHLELKVIPQKGEFVSVRLIKSTARTGRPTALIEGEHWAVAQPEEPITPAPQLPRAKPNEEF